jgi:hypothetical protein
MSITKALNELNELVKKLGIPEYFDRLTDGDMVILGLFFYGKYIEDNLDSIKEDMKDETDDD